MEDIKVGDNKVEDIRVEDSSKVEHTREVYSSRLGNRVGQNRLE